MKIHHVGYLVNDLDATLELMLALGYKKTTETVYDDYRQVNICFIENNGYCVELIIPVSNDSVVAKLKKKLGTAPYHICYEVESIEKSEANLRALGYLPMGEPTAAPAIDNTLAAFYFHMDMGIVELVEK